MSRIIKAIVITNSTEDLYGRVKVKSEGLWKETPLISVLNGIPLKKDDVVYVDVSEGFINPFIIGKAIDTDQKKSKNLDGQILFDSSDGDKWTIAAIRGSNLEIHNSKGLEIVISGGDIKIKAENIKIDADKVQINSLMIEG